MTSPRFGLLSYPGAFNLGDVIQSLAAKRFLPRVDSRIPREALAERPAGDGPVALIANGWFMQRPGQWPPHPDIVPLPVSMHFAETDYGRFQRWRRRPLDRLLAGAGADWLRRWGPVGARDQFTSQELTRRGIPNYLSGCLTTTFERPPETPRQDYLVACDLAPDELALLRTVSRREIVEISHKARLFADVHAQEAAAKQALDLYCQAAGVITSRIHAALPCLGFGTPVLLIVRAPVERRIAEVAELVHSCSRDAFLQMQHGFDLQNPTPNQTHWREQAETMAAACRLFVERVLAGDFPDPPAAPTGAGLRTAS